MEGRKEGRRRRRRRRRPQNHYEAEAKDDCRRLRGGGGGEGGDEEEEEGTFGGDPIPTREYEIEREKGGEASVGASVGGRPGRRWGWGRRFTTLCRNSSQLSEKAGAASLPHSQCGLSWQKYFPSSVDNITSQEWNMDRGELT